MIDAGDDDLVGRRGRTPRSLLTCRRLLRQGRDRVGTTARTQNSMPTRTCFRNVACCTRGLVTVSPGEGREADVILDRFRLDDQVAVVTGAGRGLGAAMALAFAEAGADVVIASRTQSATRRGRRTDQGRRATRPHRRRRPGAPRGHRRTRRHGGRGVRQTRHRREQRRRHHAEHAADHVAPRTCATHSPSTSRPPTR